LTALRAATLALALSVAVLAGLEGRALADGPGPEPAPPPPPALQPDPAPSAQPKPSGSSTSKSTPQTSFPAAVAPTPQAVASPPPAVVRPAATAPARKQQARRIVSTPNHSRKASTVHRVMRLPGLILDRTSLRAIGGQATAASTSRESRLLLAGGLALVLLVIGETTFLALAGARLGFRPGRLPRRRKSA
jgi:hypothetical protein